MYHDTFDDLLADVREADREWGDRMNERMRELLDQHDTGAEHAAGAFGYTDR
jgi:polyhydroxyalkanoate synthesis regulator phasin